MTKELKDKVEREAAERYDTMRCEDMPHPQNGELLDELLGKQDAFKEGFWFALSLQGTGGGMRWVKFVNQDREQTYRDFFKGKTVRRVSDGIIINFPFNGHYVAPLLSFDFSFKGCTVLIGAHDLEYLDESPNDQGTAEAAGQDPSIPNQQEQDDVKELLHQSLKEKWTGYGHNDWLLVSLTIDLLSETHTINRK